MRRRRWLALITGAAVLVLTPVMAGAAPLTSGQLYKPVAFFRFCAEAQLDIANIDETVMANKGITIGGSIYADYTDFVNSKSSVSVAGQSILTGQYVEYRDVNLTQPKMFRCKLRTGESIDKGAWPVGSANNGGRFAVDPYFGLGSNATGVSTNATDQQCTVVNQRTIDNVWAGLTPSQQSAAPYTPVGPTPTLKTVADNVVGAGPLWTVSVEPMSVVGSELQVKSLTLLANTNSAGVPRFEGAHYCTLVAPEYLRDVLLGTATVS